MAQLRLAVVGCGAQAEGAHLPAVLRSERVTLSALVETNPDQLERVAAKFPVPHALREHGALAGKVDAALLALPNFLHAPVAIDLLRMGIHVLVEKPMAIDSRSCAAMVDAAKAHGVNLGVGLVFRFLEATQLVHRLLTARMLGDILEFDLRLGHTLPTSYVLRSDYLLRRDLAGGGVLVDLGVHALDLALWWFGPHAQLRHFDDSLGGVEANSLVELEMASGARGTLEISRIRDLRNSCVIRGEKGTLEVGLWTRNGFLRLELAGEPHALVPDNLTVNPERWAGDAFVRQLDDFAASVQTARPPFVPGEEGKRSVELVEACYAAREAIHQPWMIESMTAEVRL